MIDRRASEMSLVGSYVMLEIVNCWTEDEVLDFLCMQNWQILRTISGIGVR